MEKGLTIGGFKSVFFADLVAAWLLENTVKIILNTCFNGITRTTDNSIHVFDEKKSTEEVCRWLRNFQHEVDSHLQFTVDILNPEVPVDKVPCLPKKDVLTINCKENFPYYLTLTWNFILGPNWFTSNQTKNSSI
jgi:hypothetical protein